MKKGFFIGILFSFGFYIQYGYTQNFINMTNGKARICSGYFYDSDAGNTPKDYDHNENYILTISIPGAKSITLNFTSFCTEKDNDILSIFNGKDTFSPLIGRYSGNKGPGIIKSTDSFITFHFKSDKSIACSGWEAVIIREMVKINAPTLSLTSPIKCNASKIRIKTQFNIPCDSVKIQNITISGPSNPILASVDAINCSNGTTNTFEINLSNSIQLNGNYSINIITYFKDYCDSIYQLTSKLNFSVTDCPLTVILKADSDTLCKGSCTQLRTLVSGGNVSRYQYTWSPALIGAGPHKICPTANTTYIVTVTDGSSIPSSDTIEITVLDPPKAQSDTSICYLSSSFNLRASPSGGKWFGKGITNASLGTFNPSGNYGVNKVWYQIGSCADTVLVTVTSVWSLENVFCPNAPPSALYWYAPTGGTWAGTGVTPNGIFTPDTPGTYILSYDWKGCPGTKRVKVEAVFAKPFDTVCESQTFHQLIFTPKGAYPNWFPGLYDSYNGRINPSLMGGPQNKIIIWNGIGCKDTTLLTVLASDAGKNDTICPAAGLFTLSGFRPMIGGYWYGRGVNDSSSSNYDPAYFFNLGKSSYLDTLTFKNGRCIDRKTILLVPTRILKKDTVIVCPNDSTYWFTDQKQQTFPTKGKWYGNAVAMNGRFVPSVAGVGVHTIFYEKNGCRDSLYIKVRSNPVAPRDTSICINNPPFNFISGSSGNYLSGPGIIHATNGTFLAAAANKGIHTLNIFDGFGCKNNFQVTVDTLPKITISGIPANVCLKDTWYKIQVNPSGGVTSGKGVQAFNFNPRIAGTGNHQVIYTYEVGACKVSNSLFVNVGDTLKVRIDPEQDSICKNTTLRLYAFPSGGDKFSYSYKWSTGITDKSTFVQPQNLSTYSVTVNDGCSDQAIATSNIFVHPNDYFDVTTSPPLCFGSSGFAKVKMKSLHPHTFLWNTSPQTIGDSITSKVGYTYGLTAINSLTGCISDTSISIPGYNAINASFNISPFNECLSNISPTLYITDLSKGGTKGLWDWGDKSAEPYVSGSNPQHHYSGDTGVYNITLYLENDGGCKDTAFAKICYRDTLLIFMPTAFSPNGDGINEQLVWSAEGVKEFELLIYNAWGQIIYKTNNIKGFWDGTYLKKRVPVGYYPYQITYKGKKTGRKYLSGTLYILK